MSHRDPAPLTTRQAAALVRGAGRELTYGLFAVRVELRAWSARAQLIPDVAIRALVLQGMDEGRVLVDGAALFWTIPRRRSPHLLRGLVALQTLLNFLDVILESDGRRFGQPRHWTWLVGYALDAHGPTLPIEIINNELGDDGGYFSALVAACRHACEQLPSYAAARDTLLREARRATSFEIEHDTDSVDRQMKMRRWAGAQFGEPTFLAPWELAGGASSLLSAMAVLGIAANPGVDPDSMRRAADVYAWVGGAAALLDSYTDLDPDAGAGAHNWFGYYESPDHAVCRASVLLRGALERARALHADGERHVVIVGAMAALALSDEAARLPSRRVATAALVESGGTLTRVLVPVLRAWRIAYGRPHA